MCASNEMMHVKMLLCMRTSSWFDMPADRHKIGPSKLSHDQWKKTDAGELGEITTFIPFHDTCHY